MVGLDPAQFNTSQEVLEDSYLVAIAWVNDGHREEVESKYINPVFDVLHPLTCPFLMIGRVCPRWKYALLR
ncbi:MAG: hypothetical protein Ct9H90mP16_04100 [Candidatus Poseidoniales archaeon]|nr:MAG: hypothetical protein Ct9H90mP16_04100 [Candidatus Poseidoniales archaeon]